MENGKRQPNTSQEDLCLNVVVDGEDFNPLKQYTSFSILLVQKKTMDTIGGLENTGINQGTWKKLEIYCFT